MKKLVPALAVLMLFPLALMAATPAPGYVTFEREYRYAAEKTDNLATCRMIALEQVKRLLLEELGTYLESNTEVRNFTLSHEKITIITAGIVRTTIIEEKWDNKTYYLKARITVDPQDVTRKIDAIRKDRQKSEELWAARKLYDEAHLALRSGKLNEAEALLKRVVLEYPRTDVANAAAENLNRLAEIRQFEIQKLDDLASNDLRKFRTLLEAYFADWMKLPSSMNELTKNGLGRNFKLADGVQILFCPEGANPGQYEYTLYSYHVAGKKVSVYKSDAADIKQVEKRTGILDELAKNYKRDTAGSIAVLSRR